MFIYLLLNVFYRIIRFRSNLFISFFINIILNVIGFALFKNINIINILLIKQISFILQVFCEIFILIISF